MKTILVPTDFSENAENALFYAIEIAKKEEAKIILLHAFTISEEDLAGHVEKARKKSEEKLKRLGAKITYNTNLAYEYYSREGEAEKVILDFIQEKNIDFVVMGTKGESNFEKVVFGSNAAHIIAKAKCPVISIPEGFRYVPIKRVIYATDYHSSDIAALKNVLDIARPFGAQINILHIAPQSQSAVEEKEMMEKFMEEVTKKINYSNISFQMLAAENIEQELKECLDSGSTDLLVMSTHPRGLWEKLFGTSLTNQMAYNSPVPLMAFHYNKQAAVKLI